MSYRISELTLLLGCTFNEARAWVRALEAVGAVDRDARGARLVTPTQLEHIAAARVIMSTRKISRAAAIRMVTQLDHALEALDRLDRQRDALGIAALEARVAALEQQTGQR